MNTVYLVLGLGIVLIIIYLIVKYTFGSPKEADNSLVVVKNTISLSSSRQVATGEQVKNFWTDPAGSTILFFINPTINDRTSISGNEYATAIDIGSKCKLNILTSSDAGRGDEYVPAELKINIKGVTAAEVIELYNIDLQRWTAVAIVKQGARFKIYLNGKLTAAYTCINGMPDSDTTQPLKLGDSNGRLGGTIANMILYSVPLSTSDINSLIKQQSDMDGKPYNLNASDLSIFTLGGLFTSLPDFLGCPGGLCTQPMKPYPYEMWTTSYA